MSVKRPLSPQTKKQVYEMMRYMTHDERVDFNHKINAKKLQKLIREKILDHRPSYKHNLAQGDDLEEVADYLLSNCGFLTGVSRNDKTRIRELDHYGLFQNWLFEMMDNLWKIDEKSFLGESKNYSKSKNRIKVDIVYKVEGLKYLVGLGVGCYFTREGLTGDDLVGATALLKEFCTNTKSVSIVFDDRDWEYLLKEPLMFNKLFFFKIDHFKKTHNHKIDHTKIKDFLK